MKKLAILMMILALAGCSSAKEKARLAYYSAKEAFHDHDKDYLRHEGGIAKTKIPKGATPMNMDSYYKIPPLPKNNMAFKQASLLPPPLIAYQEEAKHGKK